MNQIIFWKLLAIHAKHKIKWCIFKVVCHLVQIYIIGVIHYWGGVLGEKLAHHGAVGFAVDVGHGVLQDLVQLGLLHLRGGQEFALQQLLSGGPKGWVVF